MICVEVVAKATLVIERSPCASYWKYRFCIKQIFADMDFLVNVLVCAVVSVVEGYVGKSFQSVCAILQGEVVIVVPLVVNSRLVVSHYAQSVALWLQGLDTDNSIDLCIIPGTWGCNNLNILYVGGFQLFQFICIVHLLVVDVDFWLTLCENLKLAVASLYHWNH